jgi:hypothetical protein
MSIKNSEFREYVHAAQAKNRGLPVAGMIAGLVALIPVGGVYAWKSGMLERHSEATVAAAPAPQLAAAQTPPPANDPPPLRLAAAQTTTAPSGKLTSEQMAKGAALAIKIKMNPGAFEEGFGTFIEMMNESSKPARPNSDDIFSYCRYQSNQSMAARMKLARSEVERDNLTFDFMSQSLLCVMQRNQKALCKPENRSRMIRQLKVYAMVRDETIDAARTPDLKAATIRHLSQGVHGVMPKEIRTLGSKGIISTADFGWGAPKVITEQIGEFKGVKSACAG